jgi:type II secretory pathway pseudopilin PulG
MKRNQSGMTLLGFIIVLGVVGVFVYMGMKLVPMYTEFYSVKRSLADLAKEPGAGQLDSYKARDLFFRRMEMSYVDSVKQDSFKIVRNDQGMEITVKYQVRRPLIGNLDVVGNFEAKQQLRSKAGD